MNTTSKRTKRDTITTTLELLRDSNDELLQDIHRLSAKRKEREDASSNHVRAKRKPLSIITNLNHEPCPTHPINQLTSKKKRKLQTPQVEPALRKVKTTPPSHPTSIDNAFQTANPHLSITRQLFPSGNDSIVELSSDEDDPFHPTIQAMRNIYYLSPADLFTVQRQFQDTTGRCILAICDKLNFEHDIYSLSCTSTNIYSLLCKGKLMMLKGLIHPPAGFNDISWVTPPSRRASARSKCS